MKLVMDERLKHRLVGLAVLISLGAIFVPAIMKKSNQRFESKTSIAIKLPPKPTLPSVSLPNEKAMFKSTKIAHVNIPVPPNDERPASTLAKAEPLSSMDEVKATITAAKASTRHKEPLLKMTSLDSIEPVKPASLRVKKLATITKAKASPPTKAVSSPTPSYSVQIATFAQQNNAIKLVSKLKNKGYQAFYNKMTIKNSIFYKVFVGQAIKKEQAKKIQEQIATHMQIKGFIVSAHGIS